MDGIKYSLAAVSSFNPYNISGCYVCGQIMKGARYGIHGDSNYDSFWLRGEDSTTIQICGSNECFNMILLQVDKFRLF